MGGPWAGTWNPMRPPITRRRTARDRPQALARCIGLPYVAHDSASIGARFEIKIEQGRILAAEVVALPFYDPDGKRPEM